MGNQSLSSLLKFLCLSQSDSMMLYFTLSLQQISINIAFLRQMQGDNALDCVVYDPSFKRQKMKGDNQEGQFYADECDFSYTNFQNQKLVTLGKYDPAYEHLVVVPGLNLKGMCDNEKCPAFKSKKTWIRKGFGNFDINKERFSNNCAACKSAIKAKSIKSLGYTRCTISVKGMKYEGEDEIQVEKEFEENVGKLCYFTDFDQDVARWGFIEVTAKKLKS